MDLASSLPTSLAFAHASFMNVGGDFRMTLGTRIFVLFLWPATFVVFSCIWYLGLLCTTMFQHPIHGEFRCCPLAASITAAMARIRRALNNLLN